MEFFEIKVNYTRQTGEDNPASVSETYLVEALTPSSVEERTLEELEPFISGLCDVPSIRNRKFFDIIPSGNSEDWYESKVEMITIEDNGNEKRKAVTILVEADSIQKAVSVLSESLHNLDCEIVSVKKSKILEVYRSV
jgi:hypothetical protein